MYYSYSFRFLIATIDISFIVYISYSRPIVPMNKPPNKSIFLHILENNIFKKKIYSIIYGKRK